MSKPKKKTKTKINLRPGRTGVDLGTLEAEKDGELNKYYVGRDRYVNRALNIDDQAAFFVGQKGPGKSAILQMVRLEMQNEPRRIINLSTKQLALSAFVNIGLPSSLLIDANKKQWLYKSLWDYIIATEIGSKEYIDDSTIVSRGLKNLIRGKDEKAVRRLLRLRLDDQGNTEKLSTRFLKLIKELEVPGKLDIEALKLEGKATLNPEAIIKHSQFELLGLVHEVSSRLADTISNRYYILIDDLDVDWYNEPVQNEVIAAMFASLRKICRPPHLKCIGSIQDRIFPELAIEHKDKFRDSLCTVEWEAEVVKEMVEQRIQHVVVCAKDKIWKDLFPENGFDYIWNRIAGRPREAIRLASLCLDVARRNNHKSVTTDDMHRAFKKFSAERVEGLGSELGYMYPGFTVFLKHFAGYPKEFKRSNIKDAVDHCILKSLDSTSPAYIWIRGYEMDYHEMAQILLFKSNRTELPQPYDSSIRDIFNAHAHVAFHPMYTAGLGLIGGI